MPQYRLKNVGEAAEAVIYFSIDTVTAAARDIADRIGKAVTFVEESRTTKPRAMKRNPYAVKVNKSYTRPYDDYAEAEYVSRQLNKKHGLPAEIIDTGSGRPERRIALDVETARAPANKRRTKAPKARAVQSSLTADLSDQVIAQRMRAALKREAPKRPVRYNKLMGLADFGSLFRKNPAPLYGEYWFSGPHGGIVAGRSKSEIMRAAQKYSNSTGRRIEVHKEDYTGSGAGPYKAKPMRRNPVNKRLNVEQRLMMAQIRQELFEKFKKAKTDKSRAAIQREMDRLNEFG